MDLSYGDDGGEDRLSALPDDLLIQILVLVDDAAAAARTSILASRWRRLWALLPELRFASIEHHRIGAALAAHEAPDLSLLFAHTKDSSPESLSAWLPIAARGLSGAIYLEVVRREADTEEEIGAVDLPCFGKATTIMLKLGFLPLALPPSGVFARLGDLQLVDIQLHGQSSGLGDLLSSQRCPSLRCLLVRDVRGLDSFNIHSDSLLRMELWGLQHLNQLTVMAPALEWLKVINCFTDPLNPDLSVTNISAPQLMTLKWKNVNDPSSIQLNKMMRLKTLGIELFILEGEEAFEHNHYCMTLLRRFERIHTLDLMIYYLQEHTLCPSGCMCGEPPYWRTEDLALNCLEEIEIDGMGGTEHEVALVQRLFHWARVLKRMKIMFDESITGSKAKELRQLLLSFSRPDICMNISMFVP
ncbi:hypothetical protein ACQ4PT_008704 [Festuca glaucescens]